MNQRIEIATFPQRACLHLIALLENRRIRRVSGHIFRHNWAGPGVRAIGELVSNDEKRIKLLEHLPIANEHEASKSLHCSRLGGYDESVFFNWGGDLRHLYSCEGNAGPCKLFPILRSRGNIVCSSGARFHRRMNIKQKLGNSHCFWIRDVFFEHLGLAGRRQCGC